MVARSSAADAALVVLWRRGHAAVVCQAAPAAIWEPVSCSGGSLPSRWRGYAACTSGAVSGARLVGSRCFAARVSVPRDAGSSLAGARGGGGSALGAAGLQERFEEEDEDFLAETGEEMLTEDALATIAQAYHRHAGGASGVRGSSVSWEDAATPYDDDFAESRMLHPKGEAGRRPRPERLALGPIRVTRLQRLAALEVGEEEMHRRERRNRAAFNPDVPVRVRVLDVDAVPLSELHRAFMYTLVRRRPAEVCIHVASRVAQFRDSFKHQSYENLVRDCARLFGPDHGAELTALFARCHATIAVPFMVDYTRRFGSFSRAFIAAQVERSLRPSFFDFLRYEKKGGVRPLPLVVSQPWALGSFNRLLAKCSVKSHMYEQLKLHGCVPAAELAADTPEELPPETRVSERLSAAAALRVPAPVVASKWPPRPAGRARRRASDGKGWEADDGVAAGDAMVPRPALLDAIMEAEYTGRGWDEQAAATAARTLADVGAGQDLDLASLPLSVPAPAALHGAARRRQQRVSFEDEEDIAADTSGEGVGEGVGRFDLQFEHIVPDDIFEALSTNALVVDGDGAGNESGTASSEGLVAVPDRWWGVIRRGFFRHNYKAYRLLDRGWSQVPDPRGGRFKAKRRYPSRFEKKAEIRRQLAKEMDP